MSQSTHNLRNPESRRDTRDNQHIHAINPPAFYNSRAGDLANVMSTNKNPNRISSITKSIDSVLDTSVVNTAARVTRPLVKLRPSWIGPPRSEHPTTLGAEMVKHRITIEYASPGLHPPVYIFTSLSHPQWEPIEMHGEKNANGELRFSKAFEVEEGEYQYKFRLGPGDWWACDESRPTIDDGYGNKNNLLVVRHDIPKSQATSEREHANAKLALLLMPLSSPAPPGAPQPHDSSLAQLATTPKSEKDASHTSPVKLESFVPNDTAMAEHTPDREQCDLLENAGASGDPDAEQTSLEYETTAPDASEEDQSTTDDEDTDSTSSDDADDTEDITSSPLLRHESIMQDHVPLFRHETISTGYSHHNKSEKTQESPSPPSNLPNPTHALPADADLNDPSLEKFPTDHAVILDHIHRASLQLAEEQALYDFEERSPSSEALSESSRSVKSLPSVREVDEDDGLLGRIREAGVEMWAKEEASGEEMDPLLEQSSSRFTLPLTPGEPEDEDFEPKIEIERRIVIEVVEKKSTHVRVVHALGGNGKAIAVGLGLFVAIAATSWAAMLHL